MPKLYNIPSDKNAEGWAVIVIDVDRGFFATVSDWGNYAFLWTHPGCEFRKFLIGLEADYLHGKLMHGRPDQEVFDGEKTKANILEGIEEYNATWKENHGEDWPRYEEEKKYFEHEYLNDSGDFERWESETALTDTWEYASYTPEPQCRAFCAKAMPRFKKLLEEELAKEEQDKRDALAIRAVAPQLVAELRAELGLEPLVLPLVLPLPTLTGFEARECCCTRMDYGVGTMLRVSPSCPMHGETSPLREELDVVHTATQRAKEESGGDPETFASMLRDKLLAAFPLSKWEQSELTVTLVLSNGHRIPMGF